MADATTTLTFEMVQALGRQQIVRYVDGSFKLDSYHLCFSILPTTVCSTTFLVYDMIINLQLEVDHIWMRKWSFLTILYILQRYLPLFDTVGLILHHDFGANLSTHYCALNYKITSWSFMVGVMMSEIVLAFRVWAVWERRLPVAIGLVVFFLASWIPSTFMLSQFDDATEFAILPFPNFRGCFVAGGSQALHLAALVWVLWMVYDAGAFVLILIPGVAAYRRGGRSELVKTIYKDGVVYYALISLTSIFNVVVILTLPPDFVYLLSSFERILHSLLTSHAILHIRQVYFRNSTSTTQTMSEIRFGRNEHRSSFHHTELQNTEMPPNPANLAADEV
ncbi:hypothetical protein E1B28_010864 [Marasmius oreades]|uniref:DUF6533 domain-containing protein n=1 Tax=Marasmius oreades TaxID=181124 RepID=A0A9P7RUA1_9AGAR|nr:uncharacterized protein E1B28_010864 [Marasmius oreades]KAG7089158.1 hypothetical protein E1B28_010864 [Marasmius oreades]